MRLLLAATITAAAALASIIHAAPVAPPPPLSAIAIMEPTANSTVRAIVTIDQEFKCREKVTITVNATGMAPLSTHAFHIHAFGDISSPAGANSFGHFNPEGKPHGCQIDAATLGNYHVGDIGDITADAAGNAVVVFRPDQIQASLKADSIKSVIGLTVTLHTSKDDCQTQPTGNAGGRISQGVIAWKKDSAMPLYPNFPAGGNNKAYAIAVVRPTVNSTVKGVAVFRQATPTSPTEVALHITGLAPSTSHGIHIHAFGDISDPAGLAAGGHFNPKNVSHACAPTAIRHAGDFGNFAADTSGAIIAKFTSDLISLYRGVDTYALGRALIVHADPDDCVTAPTGNSGKRLSQGVIGTRNGTLEEQGGRSIEESAAQTYALAFS
ncbi:hypothetical protein HDV05_006248 [Chytridiales sp. JEL 0842]|nr:hypothetical protein HDV05_006248 [Chytridiales sp. JEL 0842]